MPHGYDHFFTTFPDHKTYGTSAWFTPGDINGDRRSNPAPGTAGPYQYGFGHDPPADPKRLPAAFGKGSPLPPVAILSRDGCRSALPPELIIIENSVEICSPMAAIRRDLSFVTEDSPAPPGGRDGSCCRRSVASPPMDLIAFHRQPRQPVRQTLNGGHHPFTLAALFPKNKLWSQETDPRPRCLRQWMQSIAPSSDNPADAHHPRTLLHSVPECGG